MSRLRDDGIVEEAKNNKAAKTELDNPLPTNIGTSEWRDPSSGSSNYGSSTQQNHSVISDMTQSEYSNYVSLSEDEDAMRRKRSHSIERSLSPQSSTVATTAQLLSTSPRKPKGIPPKPPVSLHRPPSLQSLNNSSTNDSNYSCKTELSHTNRSFVTTGSGFSEASSSVPSQSVNGTGGGAIKNPHPPILTKLSAGDSSSSLTSLHRRAVPMLYDGSSQASVEEALTEPSSELPIKANSKPSPTTTLWKYDPQDIFVERNRLDSEVSVLGMGSGLEEEENSHKQSPTSRHSSDDEDSVNYSPFPLLRHKGEGRLPDRARGESNDQERKPLQALPPPPPPPPAMAKPARFQHPLKQKGSRNRSEKEQHSFRLKYRGGPTKEMTGQKRQLESSQQMKFLSKSAVLEERILAKKNRRVVVSGWIVVLLGRAADCDKMSNSSASSNSSSIGARASLLPGFGEDDLYYMCIAEDSRNSASLVLHRSSDGRAEYVFPIEGNWVVQSRESEDRRVGRSISVKFGQGGNGLGWICMVPVALQDRWRAMLDFNLRNSTGKAPIISREADHISSEQAFLLPPPGRYASGKQLDIARHLFFTIDSFVKQQR